MAHLAGSLDQNERQVPSKADNTDNWRDSSRTTQENVWAPRPSDSLKTTYTTEELLSYYNPYLRPPRGFNFHDKITSKTPLPPVAFSTPSNDSHSEQEFTHGRGRGRGGRGRGGERGGFQKSEYGWGRDEEGKQAGRGRGTAPGSSVPPWKKNTQEKSTEDAKADGWDTPLEKPKSEPLPKTTEPITPSPSIQMGPAISSAPQMGPTISTPLPPPEAAEWFYRDPQGKERGPFTGANMEKWLDRKFFKIDLPVRNQFGPFEPLAVWFYRESRNPFTGVPLQQWLVQPKGCVEFETSLWQFLSQYRPHQMPPVVAPVPTHPGPVFGAKITQPGGVHLGTPLVTPPSNSPVPSAGPIFGSLTQPTHPATSGPVFGAKLPTQQSSAPQFGAKLTQPATSGPIFGPLSSENPLPTPVAPPTSASGPIFGPPAPQSQGLDKSQERPRTTQPPQPQQDLSHEQGPIFGPRLWTNNSASQKPLSLSEIQKQELENEKARMEKLKNQGSAPSQDASDALKNLWEISFGGRSDQPAHKEPEPSLPTPVDTSAKGWNQKQHPNAAPSMSQIRDEELKLQAYQRELQQTEHEQKMLQQQQKKGPVWGAKETPPQPQKPVQQKKKTLLDIQNEQAIQQAAARQQQTTYGQQIPSAHSWANTLSSRGAPSLKEIQEQEKLQTRSNFYGESKDDEFKRLQREMFLQQQQQDPSKKKQAQPQPAAGKPWGGNKSSVPSILELQMQEAASKKQQNVAPVEDDDDDDVGFFDYGDTPKKAKQPQQTNTAPKPQANNKPQKPQNQPKQPQQPVVGQNQPKQRKGQKKKGQQQIDPSLLGFTSNLGGYNIIKPTDD